MNALVAAAAAEAAAAVEHSAGPLAGSSRRLI